MKKAEKKIGNLLSSIIVLSIFLSVLVSLVAPVSAQPPPPPEVTELVVTASPLSIPADGASISNIKATVTEWKNIATPEGFVIHFEIISEPGGVSLYPEHDKTDVSGDAYTNLTAGLTPGTATVKAYWIGNESIYNTTTILLTQPSPAPAPAPVPTLTPIGIIALAGLLAVVAVSRIKRKK